MATCAVCKREFKTIGAMKSHLRNKHKAEFEKAAALWNKAQSPEDKAINKQMQEWEPANPTDEFADGGWEDAGSEPWKPNPGDVLIGVFDGWDEYQFEGSDSPVQRNFILTQEARFYVAAHQVSKAIHDKDIANGDMLRITYLGQIDIGGGRRLNRFRVQFKRLASAVQRSKESLPY